MSILPKDYEMPKSRSAYMKLDEGDSTFRVLTNAIVGFEFWKEEGKKRTPIRVRTYDELPDDIKNATDPRNRAKHFWIFVVLNKELGDVQILELTQAGLQRLMKGLEDSEAWGDLRGYDVTITRTNGTSPMDVKYSLLPQPKAKLSKEMQKLVDERLAQINLDLIFDGESPFITKE